MTNDKLKRFAELVEQGALENLVRMEVDCEANRNNCKVKIVPGQKYTKVDVGSSGKYMVVNETGEIFGIKAYGVIHRGHSYGTLDTVENWNWVGYTGQRK